MGKARHFCPKIYVWKINKMPEFDMVIARKIFSRILRGTCPPCPHVIYAYGLSWPQEQLNVLSEVMCTCLDIVLGEFWIHAVRRDCLPRKRRLFIRRTKQQLPHQCVPASCRGKVMGLPASPSTIHTMIHDTNLSFCSWAPVTAVYCRRPHNYSLSCSQLTCDNINLTSITLRF